MSHVNFSVKGKVTLFVSFSTHKHNLPFSDQIQFIENLPDRPSIRKVNQQEWSNVFAECQEQLLSQNQTPNPSNIHFIYPGNLKVTIYSTFLTIFFFSRLRQAPNGVDQEILQIVMMIWVLGSPRTCVVAIMITVTTV